MEKTITFIGLDVHKKSLSVAVADGGGGGEVRFVGPISNIAGGLTKLAGAPARKGGVLSFLLRGRPLRLWGLPPSAGVGMKVRIRTP